MRSPSAPTGPPPPVAAGPRPDRASRAPPRIAGAAMLQALAVASIIVPLVALVVGGWLAYRDAVHHAKAALSQGVLVAEEHAIKLLDTHQLVAARVGDLVGPLDDQEIHRREAALHRQIAAQIHNLPEVATVWVIGADGHELVAATRYPVDATVDFADRDYFRALQDPKVHVYISAIESRRAGRPLFTVAVRKNPGGTPFGGVIVVAVSPDYFRGFYEKLFGDSTDHVSGMFLDSGVTLARYPAGAVPVPPAHRSALLLKAIARNPVGGIISGHSSLDGVDRLVPTSGWPAIRST